ncbi:MAG: aldehyde ferredoxin oxidoreductase family protein [Candidatus Bathyarchaeota archaeon]
MKATQFYGWAGRVLQVDLAKGKFVKENLDREFALTYMGGRGFTSRLQWDLVPKGTDPLSPDNVLMFSVGPLTGTLSPGSSRWTVAAKSPLTGGIGDGNACGTFGAELKWAGYDMIIIRGKAKNPSYLWIDNDEVILADAGHIWSKYTRETERMIREELGDPNVRVAAIGPAAENQVKYCGIVSEMRGGGRCGVGTVMASKKMKALAVRGTKGVKIAKPEEFEEACMSAKNAIVGEKDPCKHAGTLAALASRSEEGGLGTRNNQTGVYEDAEKISGTPGKWDYWDKQFVQRMAYLCPLPSDQFWVSEEGPNYGHGLQFGTAFGHFGSELGISNVDTLLKVHALVDDLGIETFTLGCSVAFAFECYEKGILTKGDTDGLELTWGNADAMFAMIYKIAYREGYLGKILAEGPKRAAEVIGKGSEHFALHVKGLSAPVTDDPRAWQGAGLAYAVASRGGDHRRGMVLSNRFNPVGQGEEVKIQEGVNSVKDSLIMCAFFLGRDFSLMAKLYSTATGVEIDERGLMRIGERITNVEKAFNVREGMTRKDDTLPKRFLEEPMPEGPSKGQVVHLEQMLDEYYAARGWDVKTSLPRRAKLEELGLNDLANQLAKLGKLSE